MSEELAEVMARHVDDQFAAASMIVTSFAGGVVDGPCVQLTPQGGSALASFVQLDRRGVEELVRVLEAWLRE